MTDVTISNVGGAGTYERDQYGIAFPNGETVWGEPGYAYVHTGWRLGAHNTEGRVYVTPPDGISHPEQTTWAWFISQWETQVAALGVIVDEDTPEHPKRIVRHLTLTVSPSEDVA